MSCTECGALTAWDDDASSLICQSCGTLVDPSQSVLVDSNVSTNGGRDPAATFKSFRSGSNWDLPGQGKEARDRKNGYAMTEFINSLALSLNAPGLSPRVIALFNQAKTTPIFRWGRKAKLIASACLIIALREHNRPDSLHDIAVILSEKISVLVRTLSSVISILNISLTPSDPSVHIPDLLTHLSSLVSDPTSDLELAFRSQLKLLPPLRPAANTATSLSKFLARLGPDHRINQLPSPPTACALFLLALEAETRTPLAHLGGLAQFLATRCNSSRGIVMERYKLVQDEITAWVERVPWLHKYERSANAKGKIRAKLGKRLVVARGLNDVLQFQEEIWREKLKPSVMLETSDGEQEDDISEPENTVPFTPQSLFKGPTRPNKRQKTRHYPLRDATQFLLHPLSTPIPPPVSGTHPRTSPTYPRSSNSHCSQRTTNSFLSSPHHTSTALTSSSLALASYVLTVPHLPATSLFSNHSHLPTRLQLLAVSRGGVGEDHIGDEELFQEGELEGMLRGDEEAEKLRTHLIELGVWDDHDDATDTDAIEQEKEGRKKRRRKRMGGYNDDHEAGKALEGEEDLGAWKRKSRVDLEALARFLQDSPDSETGGDDDKGADDTYDYSAFLGLERFAEEDADDNGKDHRDYGGMYDSDHNGDRLQTPKMYTGVLGGDEVVVDEWRPLSPEVGTSTHADSYEEEYD